MLNSTQLKRFYRAVEIIDEYFDFNRFDTNKIDKVIEFGERGNLEGINAIMNVNKLETSDELLDELFNIKFSEINNEAHKLGYSKIY